MRVDVVVLDKKGVPVSNLKAEDFELEDEGEPQEIKSFQYVTADGQPDADNELSLTIRSKSHAAAEASRDNVRVFLIFWDEYHIGQIASAVRARTSLMQFVRTAFGPTDIVAFMDPLTPIDALVFTRDRLELFDRTRKLIGRSGVYVPTRSAVEDAHLQRGDIERLRSEVTISALKAAAMHLGGLRDGRKSIILVSEGLRGLRDYQDPLNDLVRSANTNNTAIYALDPRGFGPQRFGSLFEGVAVDTGGEYFRSNDLLASLQSVVTQSSGFYLLGYSAAERATDGKYHKLRVKVKGSGLEVRARAGYWAPSVADMTRAKVRAAEAELPPDMTRAFLDLPKPTARRTDRPVGRGVAAGGPPDGAAGVAAATAGRRRPGGDARVGPRRTGADEGLRRSRGSQRHPVRGAAGAVARRRQRARQDERDHRSRRQDHRRSRPRGAGSPDQRPGRFPDAIGARAPQSRPRSRGDALSRPGVPPDRPPPHPVHRFSAPRRRRRPSRRG